MHPPLTGSDIINNIKQHFQLHSSCIMGPNPASFMRWMLIWC